MTGEIQSGFVHLRLHTEYSLVDGLIRVKPLMQTLSERGMNAVAVTDHCNLFAAVKVFQSAAACGIKPIIGCELLCYDVKTPDCIHPLILLCQNEFGYRNLTRLVSKAYQEGQTQGVPRIQTDWIQTHAEGLIALSGGRTGNIGQALLEGHETLALSRAKAWMRVFPERFYLEIQRVNQPDEAVYNEKIVQLAESLELPLVATNDVRFLEEADFEAHEARVCIHDGYTLADPRRSKRYQPKQYLRSADEMCALFSDLPNALQNTVEISKRCTVQLELGQNYLPNFPVPKHSTVEGYLCELSKAGLEKRFQQLFKNRASELDVSTRTSYETRLQKELDVINAMGFAGYFLIVADFIQWAKQNGIPVGPGRGSGAGSLVAYALDITDLDPLPYDLLFERFLNPERVSMPDFDIDFCMQRRDRVIDYVADKYGRHSVSQIITFGTMAAKAVVRDVGRVLGHPYGFVDKLAKLIPFELGMTLQKALTQEALLRERYEQEEEVKELIDLALKLEGITRNAGKHAGGVVIAPSALTDFTAIYCEAGSTQLVSQFDKDDVEAAGLVKFDFLGLRTLTIIDWALAIINDHRQANDLPAIKIVDIPMDDKATFDLLKSCQTTAVFQLESRGMKELIHRLQPDCFEDIIALVALFRPGPLQSGMVDDFIDRKHGRSAVQYPHPDLETILKPTYGVILYQEQVMQIAQVLANYTLGAADLLRRAMGKKKPEEMAKQRAIFTEGACERGVSAETANVIFDLMEKFAGYGFNKSHSAAYALLAYQTAWLKAHFPAAFMAAVMSCDMDNTDKVVVFIQACKQLNIKVLPPSVNQSLHRFSVLDEQTIIYGLGAIKGVGEAAVLALLEVRQKEGDFAGLFSFCRRMDLRKVNRRVLEALIKSGAMDEWGIDRGILCASLDNALQVSAQLHQNESLGQADLLGLIQEEPVDKEAYVAGSVWDELTRLKGEQETLGFYLTGHPVSAYQKELNSVVVLINQLNPASMRHTLICAMVKGIRRLWTKKGKKLVILSLEDASGYLEAVVFEEVFQSVEQDLQAGQILVIEGEISQDDYSGGIKMTVSGLYPISVARARFAKCMTLRLTPEDAPLLPKLRSIIEVHQGECTIQIRYVNKEAQAAMVLASQWRVKPTDEVLSAFRALLDDERVELNY